MVKWKKRKADEEEDIGVVYMSVYCYIYLLYGDITNMVKGKKGRWRRRHWQWWVVCMLVYCRTCWRAQQVPPRAPPISSFCVTIILILTELTQLSWCWQTPSTLQYSPLALSPYLPCVNRFLIAMSWCRVSWWRGISWPRPPPYLPHSVSLSSAVAINQSRLPWCWGIWLLSPNLPFILIASTIFRQISLVFNNFLFIQIVLIATSTLPDGYHCNCWNIRKSLLCSIKQIFLESQDVKILLPPTIS